MFLVCTLEVRLSVLPSGHSKFLFNSMNARLSVLRFVASVQPLYLRKSTNIQQKQHNPAYFQQDSSPYVSTTH